MIYYELYSVGLHHEGLYRVAGFHDHIEAIRKEFDLGESSAVLKDRGYTFEQALSLANERKSWRSLIVNCS